MRDPRAALERYAVEDRGHDTACWIWQGRPDGANGYGRLRVGNGRRKPAHLFFYEHLVGPVPDGLQLDHLCGVSLCVNPAHLEPVTGTVNNRRRRWNRLTEETAAQIRERCEQLTAGTTRAGTRRKRLPAGKLAEIAEEFGCSRQAVMHVWKGRTWR